MIPIKDHVRSKSFPFFNLLFLGINIYVFARQVILPDAQALQFTIDHAFVAQRFLEDPLAYWFTPLTTLFFHGGFVHFGGNMLFLFIFGDNVEDALGHLRYLFFYLFAGVLSLVVQLIVVPDMATPVIGASGAISGVLGAYLVLFPLARVTTLIPIGIFLMPARLPAFVFLFLWVVVQALSGYLTIMAGPLDNVAYFAHIGGFIYGFAIALSGRRRYLEKFRRRGIYGTYRSR
ncbi:MAG: rhomboid family intramembrane serine protease [Spirochaetaceae bacterium]|nr:MAG: rhomboid family intramembrane serine protease [Spirochaetaceae bacterium]